MSLTVLKNLISNIALVGNTRISATTLRSVFTAFVDTLSKDIAFTTAIPFNRFCSNLGQVNANSSLVFTIDGTDATAGMGATVILIGDGTHTPDFSAFKKVGSGTYDTTSNIANEVFFCFDGTYYCYSVNQLGTASADVTAPTVSSMTAINSTTIRVVFNEPMGTVSIAGWAFNNGGAINPSSVASASGITNGYDFTVSGLANGQTITGTYNSSTGATADLANNKLASFTNQSVTNNIGLPQLNAPTTLAAGTVTSTTVPLTWTDTNTSPNEVNFELQQSSDGGTTWVAATPNNPAQNAVSATAGSLTAGTAYQFRIRAKGNGTTSSDSAWSNVASATTSGGVVALNFATVNNFTNTAGNWGGSVSNYNNYGLADKKLAASTDGYVQWQYVDTNGENAILAFSLNNTNKNYQTNLYHAAAYIYQGTIYRIDNGGAVTTTGVTIAVGSYLRIIRTAGLTKLQKSADAVTWTDVYTYATLNGTANNNADFFINGNTDTTFKLEQPKGFNLI